jgi:hypothetical protein
MSYDTPEASVKDGRPYFLYQFASSAGTTRLTSEPVDLTRDAGDGDVTWTASPISHDKMEQNGNVEKQEIELTFPLSDTFAAGFLVPATAITTLTVFRGHHTDLTDELRTIWKGRVVGAHSGGQTITMLGESHLHQSAPNRLHRARPADVPARALPSRLQPRQGRLRRLGDGHLDQRTDRHRDRGGR